MNPLKAFPFDNYPQQRNYSPGNYVKKERPSQTSDILRRSKSSGVLRKSQQQNLTSNNKNILSNSKINVPQTPSSNNNQQMAIFAQKAKMPFSQSNVKRDTKNIINRKLNSLIVNNNDDPSSFFENNNQNLIINQTSKNFAKSTTSANNNSSLSLSQHIQNLENGSNIAATIKNKHSLKFRFTNDQPEQFSQNGSSMKLNMNLSSKMDSAKNYSFSNSFIKLKVAEEMNSNNNNINKNEKNQQHSSQQQSHQQSQQQIQSQLQQQQQQLQQYDKQNKQLQIIQEKQQFYAALEKQQLHQQPQQQHQQQQQQEKASLQNYQSLNTNNNNNNKQIVIQKQKLLDEHQKQEKSKDSSNPNSQLTQNIYQALLSNSKFGKLVSSSSTAQLKQQQQEAQNPAQPSQSQQQQQQPNQSAQSSSSSSLQQLQQSLKKSNLHSQSQSQDFSNILNSIQVVAQSHHQQPSYNSISLSSSSQTPTTKFNHYNPQQQQQHNNNNQTRQQQLSQQQRAHSQDPGSYSTTSSQSKTNVGVYAVKTKAGALPGKPIKTNQDSFIVQANFLQKKNKFLFGVCDGHGVNGHMVSQYVKKHLPQNIEHYYKVKLQQKPNNNNNNNNNQNESDTFMLKNALTTAFLKTQQDLVESEIDVNFSGSTTVVLYVSGNTVWCSNVGDSRAVVATQKGNTLVCKPLSIDQKPDNDFEHRRIINCGGRVEPFRDMQGKQMGPFRVWLKSENIPGLAMSRSFGDYVASQVGVISEPEITSHEISENDKFIIVASDGVWEFLTNEQVINFVVPFYIRNDPEGACDKLIKEATDAWKKEDDVVDDITAIVIFLGQGGGAGSNNNNNGNSEDNNSNN